MPILDTSTIGNCIVEKKEEDVNHWDTELSLDYLLA